MATGISRREWMCGAGAGLGAAWLGGRAWAAGGAAAGSSRPPNIVLIFADDLGYGDLGCYGAENIRTLRLDAMAAEGLRFTDFYTCSAVCTPSRAGLLTGRHPLRTGMTQVLFPNSKTGLPPSEITLATALRARGYATACVGKWHLGHLPPHLPLQHGFDEYFGIPYSNDMDNPDRGQPPTPLLRGNETIESGVDQDQITTRYTEEAVAFIRQSKDRPFFLYLPHTMPHVPLHVSDRFRGKSPGGLYGDVIGEMDWSTGVILDTLGELGLDGDTIVLFTSDNGPWLTYGEHGGSAGPLRMGKGSTFDGGVRVPCIARWPGRIAPGRVDAAPAWTLDLFPTLLGLAGDTPPGDRVIDGHDIAPLLLAGTPPPERDLIFHEQRRATAIRRGDWKFKPKYKGNIYGETVEHPPLLFNLAEEIGERTNRIAEHPEIASALEARLRAFEGALARGGAAA